VRFRAQGAGDIKAMARIAAAKIFMAAILHRGPAGACDWIDGEGDRRAGAAAVVN